MSVFNFNQEKDIIQMYKDKIPVDDIIIKYNTEEHAIRCVLKENQVDRKYNTFSKELYDRIIFLYDNKYTKQCIMYDLLIGEHAIDKTLERNNISKRSYSENNQKYKRDSHYFDEIDNENKAYYLGLLFADGNNFSKHNAITLSLQEEDGYLVEKFKDEIKYEGLIHYDKKSEKNPNHKNQVRITINDEYMSRKLYQLGVVDNKGLILKFPQYLNDKFLRHFIRGYFDGDGGVYYDEKRNRLTTNTTGTFNVVMNIKNILKSLGINCSIHHPKQSLDHNTYILSTCGNNNSLKYLSWMYEDSYIKMIRKFDKYLYGKIKHGTNENLIKPNELYK